MVFVCAVKSCINNKLETKEIGCQLNCLPKHISLAHQWLKKCGRLDLRDKSLEYLINNVYVCSKHFTVQMFSRPENIGLLPMAVPTEFESTEANCNEPTPSLYLDKTICPGLQDRQSNSCATSSNTTQTIEHSNESRILNQNTYQSYNFSSRQPQSVVTNAQMNQSFGYPFQPSETPPTPTIKFETLPFFKTIQIICIPMILSCDDKRASSDTFCLTNDLRCLINKSWNKNLKEYKVRVILIFEQVGHNDIERLPYNLKVVVNNLTCTLPMINTSKEKDGIPWRWNVPIDITELVNLTIDNFQNDVLLFWSREPHQYKAGIIVAEKLHGSELLQRFDGRPILPSFKTKEFIKNSLHGPQLDAEMNTEELVITVLDPFIKRRMQLPARGYNCVHLQCFDALQFLLLNEKREKWKCPICMNKVKFENIVVDQYFLDIIKSPNLSAACENVILRSDGSWTEKKKKNV